MKAFLVGWLLLGLLAVYGSTSEVEDFDKIIDEINKGDAKWKAGHNFAPNAPMSYFKRLMGAKKSPLRLPIREEHQIPDSDIPEQFDSREHWPQCPTISHIRDQGNCGSCWAVAAAGAFSDRYCIASEGNFTLPLSDEELLTCCFVCGGCDGGYPNFAWIYFKFHGIVSGGGYKSQVGCQPYQVEACDHHSQGDLPPCSSLPDKGTPFCYDRCTNPSYNRSFSLDHHKVHRSYSVSSKPSEIQKEIMLHGPVEAAFNVFADFLTYKSGIYHHVTGRLLGGHAVRIIGWGVEEGTPHWLVANSWNTDWGDNGLFKILRGHDHCGIESGIIAGIPEI